MQAAKQDKKLSEAVAISRQFLRSIRIDTDLGRTDALSGYICQGTAQGLLESMSQQILQSKQGAFTWTGPYGGGKSSLALMLCALVGPSASLRKRAVEVLALPAESPVNKAFSAKSAGWVVMPIVGKRSNIKDELRKIILEHEPKLVKDKNFDICKALDRIAVTSKQGLLLIIDELGKFLEATALENGEDINFFQELAETACRSNGNFVLVGILHQPFEAYASRLGRQARDDWAKVQGRYIDIPLVSGPDEVVELISKSVTLRQKLDLGKFKDIARRVAESVKKRRPTTPKNLPDVLFHCWPLHPVTTSLIGPVSRRRFGQNERSVFGFLTSKEPFGFGEFLESHSLAWSSLYKPSNFWDYLRANMEPAILSSTDGHKWSQAVDAVERTEAKGTNLHIEITKTVALVEMFRTGSALAADIPTISSVLVGVPETNIEASIDDLISWKILINRKHIGAFGVYAGSDFDVDGSINQVRAERSEIDSNAIAGLSDQTPIIAKKIYYEKGTMYCFTKQIVLASDLEAILTKMQLPNSSVGSFFLCLPDAKIPERQLEPYIKRLSETFSAQPAVIGLSANASNITEMSLDLLAAERVFATRTELQGDSVARREIVSRIGTLKQALQEESSEAFRSAKWFFAGKRIPKSESKTLAAVASVVAEEIYHLAPAINNELINRDELSTNIVKARRELMYRMISRPNEPRLGYEGFPPDAGLYYSVLQDTGFHRTRGPLGWAFGKPSDGSFEDFWVFTDELIKGSEDYISLEDVYQSWRRPPFGLKRGVMPVFALAYVLANRSHLAIYFDEVFTPDISEVIIDELLHDPRRMKFAYVAAGENKSSLAKAISTSLDISTISAGAQAPLEVARGLVAFVFSLPQWARRTNTVSKAAQEVRSMLLRANDPNKVLFADLPTILETKNEEELVSHLKEIVNELSICYPAKIAEINVLLMRAIHHTDADYSELNDRARSIKGIAGEFEIEAFVNRIEEFDGSIEKTEALISLAASKPPNMWTDRDLDTAALKLASNAVAFRKAEAVAPLRDRKVHRKYFNLVLSGGDGKDLIQEIEISTLDMEKVNHLVDLLKKSLIGVDKKLAFASLAELGLEISK